jgi:acyl carrier protein
MTVNTATELLDKATERRGMCQKLRYMIVERLDLPIPGDWITDDQPLFGRGLELDSIDALELILGIEAEFSVSLTEDEMEWFGSVSKLVERITLDEELTVAS